MSARCSAAAAGLILLLAQPGARAAELQVWTARVGATVLGEIGSEFERMTGHTLKISHDLPDPFLQRVRAGEPFDVPISTVGPIDALIQEGRRVRRRGQRQLESSGCRARAAALPA